jgi:hypothetical protein
MPFEVQGWRLTLMSKCPYTVTSIMSDDKSLVPFSNQSWSTKDCAVAQAIALVIHEDEEIRQAEAKEKEEWTLPVDSPSSADSWDLDVLTPIPKTLATWLEGIPDQPELLDLKTLIADLRTEWRMAVLLLEEAENTNWPSEEQLQNLFSRFERMKSMVMPLVGTAWQKAHPKRDLPMELRRDLWDLPMELRRENTLALGRATRARKGDFEHQTKKKAKN